MSKIYLTENELNTLVENCVIKILKEGRNLVDNFDKVAKLMTFESPDDFYFVQIIKRNKDNKNLGATHMSMQQKKDENYHAGGWYRRSYRIRSVDELMYYKPEIIDICNKDNARAYITLNTRSEKETNEFVPIYIKQLRTSDPKDPRILHANDIVPGQAKRGPNWKDVRKRLFMDIDTDDKSKQDDIVSILQKNNVNILDQYNTPSGGLHVILPDKNDPNFLNALRELSRKYGKHDRLDRMSVVAPEFDGKILLYANVETPGYK